MEAVYSTKNIKAYNNPKCTYDYEKSKIGLAPALQHQVLNTCTSLTLQSPRMRARFCTGVRSCHLGTGMGSSRALQRPKMPPSPSVLPMRRSIT